jgi:hypothetical protein
VTHDPFLAAISVAAGYLEGSDHMRGRKSYTLAGGLITAALLMGGTTPALASAEALSGTNATAACLSVVEWYTEKQSRYVKVKNSCTSSKTYCVDINNWPDKGPYTISGSTTKSQRYAGSGAPRGRGVYTSSECGPL